MLLHDHLDGGLRPQTVIELARDIDYELPTYDADDLGAWFRRWADRKSLPLFLESIRHAVGVMQTERSDRARGHARPWRIWPTRNRLCRAALRTRVVHAAWLTLDEVMSAAAAGLEEGVRRAEGVGRRIETRVIVAAMRQADNSLAAAQAALRWRDRGVVGFDLAGPEEGFLPSLHGDALRLIRGAGLHLTLHAGEESGLDSIAEALEFGAERLGHGVRIIDDIAHAPGSAVVLGPLARQVLDRPIALEICPTSNVQTGVAGSIETLIRSTC